MPSSKTVRKPKKIVAHNLPKVILFALHPHWCTPLWCFLGHYWNRIGCTTNYKRPWKYTAMQLVSRSLLKEVAASFFYLEMVVFQWYPPKFVCDTGQSLSIWRIFNARNTDGSGEHSLICYRRSHINMLWIHLLFIRILWICFFLTYHLFSLSD